MKFLKESKWVYFFLTVAVGLVLCLLMVILKKVNVEYVGDTTMTIGLSKINKGVYNALGESKAFDLLSTIILFASMAAALFFVGLGLFQAIKRKKLELIDNSIKSLALTYILVAWVYVIFDFVLVINHRPTNGGISTSPSFPSTHTMVICTVILTGITMIEGLIKNKKVLYSIEGVAGLLGILGIVFRMLSGRHWFTDIIAGILFGIMFYLFHKFVTEALNDYDKKKLTVEEKENIASKN